jgi:hypothetical protein
VKQQPTNREKRVRKNNIIPSDGVRNTDVVKLTAKPEKQRQKENKALKFI